MPEFDYHDALIQIEMLFQSHILSFGYKEYSLETFADKKYFSVWKGKEGCADTDEMRAGLNIDGILRSEDPSENEVLTYLQYTLNIAELCRRSFNAEETPGYDFDIRNYTELLSRIRELLKLLKYEVKFVAEKELIYLVPHDPAADAVEAVPEDPVSAIVTEYRSSGAVGQIDKKRQLLGELYDTISGYDDNKKGGNARLSNKIEFLLNVLGIRADEANDSEVERIREMNPDELEDWYDETYQLLLLRILEHSNIARMQKVDELAKECGMELYEITEEEMASLLSGPGVPDMISDTKAEALVQEEETEIAAPPVHKNDGSRTVRNVVIALIIADVLFAAFVLFYMFLV